ncbi:MAG: folate-binding protein [Acidobacteria bacterium]|nr:MAG: folate-binding protein [Acidobacteriota bacterium]
MAIDTFFAFLGVYSDVDDALADYEAVKDLHVEAGLLDRSGRPRITVTGGEAAEFLQGQVTNDVEALEPGAGCYALLLDRKGRIRADMRVLRLAADAFLIDTEPELGEDVLGHLGTYNIGRDAAVTADPEPRSLLSLLGPMAAKLLGGAISGPEHAHRELLVAGVGCRAAATAAGADLLVPAAGADAVRDRLLAEGAQPVAEDAAEITRVEAGRPRVGLEIGPRTMPAEAGLEERAVSFTKGCYIGQEPVARLHYKGRPNRHLRRLRASAPVAAGDPVTADERELGAVGTAVVSPAGGPLALAILRREAEPGDEVAIGADATATVEAIDA